MTELDSLWETIQNQLRASTQERTYTNLIAPAKAVSLANNRLVIEFPFENQIDFWQSNSQITEQIRQICFTQTGQHVEPIYVLANSTSGLTPTMTPPPTLAGSGMSPETPLNPEYTFANFIQGRSNQMAYASAFGASEQPGVLYNPLLIYGGVGLGKTHLMQAIANKMLERNPNARIKYVTSETFVNDYVNSIRRGSQEQFRNEYRNLDALLVDDIQFFASKDETQLEFFNTFNALHDNNKQIVLTADQNPKQIPNLTERLVSRFVWGVPVEITSPGTETRIAILQSKAEEEHMEVPNEVLELIASKVNTNVRELEGALMRVRVFADLNHQPMTPQIAAEALQGMGFADNTPALTIDLIQKEVAQFFNINQSDILGKKRSKNIVVPRQIAMFLSRELTDNSLPKIGSEFGGKDHTTVMHAIEKIEANLKTDEKLNRDLQQLRQRMQ
ncbi:chromosomal replication initiator protein DnaA [Limosilactobacillus equigenerosi]|uniref:chromosomal replication initiator protein DnaA n=1 Tax=Limosilactobacillus equigenerosi TaxID=417373 RepID=UPI000704EDD4|nr:chromosomal replication initiator protein DnaA [Limosilactobacillus equigenerosi]